MNTTELLNKVRQSKNRLAKLTTELGDETAKHTALVAELQMALTAEIGTVNITSKPYRNNNPNYMRNEIIARIIALRATNTPFDAIAATLNREKFQPKSAAQFTTATVYRMYQDSQKSQTVAA